MTPQANGIGKYKGPRTKSYNPNGNSPIVEQVQRMIAAGAEMTRVAGAEMTQVAGADEQAATLKAMRQNYNVFCGTLIDDFINNESALYLDYQQAKEAAQAADPLRGLAKLESEFYVKLTALHTKFKDTQALLQAGRKPAKAMAA